MALQITESNFEEEVMKSPVPVLVDFWSPWCGPCKMIAPMVDQIATEMAGRAKVCKANVDEARGLAARFKVSRVPALVFVKNGEVADTLVGTTTKDTILAHLRACL